MKTIAITYKGKEYKIPKPFDQCFFGSNPQKEMTIHNITTVAIALIGFLSMVTLLYVNVHYHVPKKAFTAILTSSLTVSYFIAPLYHSIAYDRVCNRVSEQYENILRDN